MVPGRVLLHEEEVQIIERKKKRKAMLFLFSDILVITKRNGRVLTALEPPLLLQDMIVQDINCGQGNSTILSNLINCILPIEEFQVTLVDGVSHSHINNFTV